MLPTIEGTELPNSFLSAFSFERVLEYYDGPRLLLQKRQAGQLYLAWWSDSDDSTERWIYLPLSEQRLRQILSGEMPSLEGLEQPEDGSLFVIDKDLNTDSIIRTIQTDAAALPDDARPRPGARLNIPIPEEISGLATREGAHVLDVRIESSGQGRDGGFAADFVSQVVGNIQKLLDALGQAASGEAISLRGRVPNHVKERTRLALVGTYPGSLGLRFETVWEDPSADKSLARSSLEGLFSLLEVGDGIAEFSPPLGILNARVTANYNDFLSTIEASSWTASLSWTPAWDWERRQFNMTPIIARRIKEKLTTDGNLQESAPLAQGPLPLEGSFLSGDISENMSRFSFGFIQAGSGKRFTVTATRGVYRRVGPITLGSQYRITVYPNLRVNQSTGEESVTYTLTNLQPG